MTDEEREEANRLRQEKYDAQAEEHRRQRDATDQRVRLEADAVRRAEEVANMAWALGNSSMGAVSLTEALVYGGITQWSALWVKRLFDASEAFVAEREVRLAKVAAEFTNKADDKS